MWRANGSRRCMRCIIHADKGTNLDVVEVIRIELTTF